MHITTERTLVHLVALGVEEVLGGRVCRPLLDRARCQGALRLPLLLEALELLAVLRLAWVLLVSLPRLLYCLASSHGKDLIRKAVTSITQSLSMRLSLDP